MTTVPARHADTVGPTVEQIVLAGFLAAYREPTRSHHEVNLKGWFAWCYQRGITPVTAERAHIEVYARELEELRGLKVSTVCNKLASINRFYHFAMIDHYINVNPAEHVRRPSVPRMSTTNGLSRAELLAVLDLAQKTHPRDHALLCILGLNGLRIGEALAIDIEDLSRQSGYHTVKVKREKGGDTPVIPLAPRTSWAVEQTIYGRTSGPLFLMRNEERMDRRGADRIVKRIVRGAGITKRISPHSFRHTFITLALDAGVSVRDVQNSVGHHDARQVSYYDRNKSSLPRNATHFVAAYVEGA